jgi:hypothetical protein
VIAIKVDGREVQGRTTNVSRGGLCAEFPAQVKYGTEVSLAMVLVFDEGTQSEALEIPARCVWCTPVDEGWQVGFAFKPMPAERAQYLTMFLRYLDDSGPRTKQPKVERSVDDQFR